MNEQASVNTQVLDALLLDYATGRFHARLRYWLKRI